MFPWIPTNCEKPPTLYAFLNSMLNFENDTPVKIKNLAKEGHSYIFDFDYPLTNKINKDDFEIMIINHFLMRRIGYETLTAFQLALQVKMNEIMPYYNLMLNAIEGWELFNDGETVERIQSDNNKNTSTGSISSNDTSTQDLRYSQMPQNNIQDIQNGEYMTEYNYNTNKGNNNTNTSNIDNYEGNTTETIKRSPSDKINTLKTFMQETISIYSMILKDLDSLFYQLV